jgi:hypothetical protein
VIEVHVDPCPVRSGRQAPFVRSSRWLAVERHCYFDPFVAITQLRDEIKWTSGWKPDLARAVKPGLRANSDLSEPDAGHEHNPEELVDRLQQAGHDVEWINRSRP